jgi:hypothetical protein
MAVDGCDKSCSAQRRLPSMHQEGDLPLRCITGARVSLPSFLLQYSPVHVGDPCSIFRTWCYYVPFIVAVRFASFPLSVIEPLSPHTTPLFYIYTGQGPQDLLLTFLLACLLSKSCFSFCCKSLFSPLLFLHDLTSIRWTSRILHHRLQLSLFVSPSRLRGVLHAMPKP